jgi:hypothetical protein
VERLYFACRVRMNGSDAFVIWYQDDRDGFVRKHDERLLVADSVESLAEAAAEISVTLVPDETTDYDFDRLRAWCEHANPASLEYATLLNAWNFFDDLARLNENPDSNFAKLSRSAETVYDKIFWGNNLPSVTPGGERFVPMWEADELDTIRQVMESGLALLEAELRV